MASSSSSNASAPAFTPGVIFKPTDRELVFDYLMKKVSGHSHAEGFRCIKDILNIYDYEPSNLQGLAYDSGHKNMYFFTRLHKKRKNVVRQVPGGYWKKTGMITEFKGDDGKTIAKKTSLAYYKTDQTSATVKGEWLMKEYMPIESEQLPNQQDQASKSTQWILCVIYYKPGGKSKN